MKKILSMAAMAAIVLLASCSDDDEPRTLTINFNGLLSEAESEYVGPKDNLPEGSYYYESTFTDPTGTCTFTHYVPTFGNAFGGGFTYTNKTDVTTPGYTNSSAITAKGVNGDTYLICNCDGYSRKGEITLKSALPVVSAYFTNATYAYLSMRDGDGYAEPFGADDWFKVIVTGWNASDETGRVEVYLAKDGAILKDWQKADLSGLGIVDKLSFSFASTDNGQWGMNTPAYFCMDALTFEQ